MGTQLAVEDERCPCQEDPLFFDASEAAAEASGLAAAAPSASGDFAAWSRVGQIPKSVTSCEAQYSVRVDNEGEMVSMMSFSPFQRQLHSEEVDLIPF